jgi:hypothetical protein
MAIKGFKSQRGSGEIYDEVKKRVSVALTETGVSQLDALAKSLGLSRSELVERIGRSLIPIAPVETKELEALKAIAIQKGISLAEVASTAIRVFIETSATEKRRNKLRKG